MRQYTPTSLVVPAGTPSSAPVAQSWTPYPAWVHSFRIEIPTGHNGLTGVRLVWHGTPVVPFDLVTYLVGNGRTFEIPFGDELDDAGLSIQGFNNDVWPHTFYLYADVDPYHRAGGGIGVPSPRSAIIPPATKEQIASLSRVGGVT